MNDGSGQEIIGSVESDEAFSCIAVEDVHYDWWQRLVVLDAIRNIYNLIKYGVDIVMDHFGSVLRLIVIFFIEEAVDLYIWI